MPGLRPVRALLAEGVHRHLQRPERRHALPAGAGARAGQGLSQLLRGPVHPPAGLSHRRQWGALCIPAAAAVPAAAGGDPPQPPGPSTPMPQLKAADRHRCRFGGGPCHSRGGGSLPHWRGPAAQGGGDGLRRHGAPFGRRAASSACCWRTAWAAARRPGGSPPSPAACWSSSCRRASSRRRP